MVGHSDPSPHSLRDQGSDEVLVEDPGHGGPGHPRDQGGLRASQRQGGQDEVTQVREQSLPEGGIAPDRVCRSGLRYQYFRSYLQYHQ